MESVLNPTNPINNDNLVKKLDTKKTSSSNLLLAVISIVVVLAGIGTGYYFSRAGKGDTQKTISSDMTNSENEAGVADETTFPDSAEGILEEGGINGEGTHHLVRGAGPSQYAYLTSTVINLDKFVGKKVQVWGQTITGKKAGWLMDIGKIKVLE
jgi:hypothetical protein